MSIPVLEQTALLDSDATHGSSLGMWDVISLMIGIVVGVSIFKVPGTVFLLAGDPFMGLAIWGIGAALALSGAMCYAELAAAYPRFGAEYIYLGQAYGRHVAFLFGWMQTCVILPGSVGAMAFVFATYAGEISPRLHTYSGLVAACAIAGLALLQLIGFQVGKVAQNLLTAIKVISLSGVLLCGLCLSAPAKHVDVAEPTAEAVPVTSSRTWGDLGLALVFVLYSYGGWSDVATVTPEVRECRKNMPRALAIGLTFIAGLYLLLNFSFLRGLGYTDLCHADAPAAEVVRRALGPTFSNLMSVVIMASALGAIHGMMFSGCRLLAAIGQDFPLFRKWNVWNQRHVPVWSLSTVSGISILFTAIAGTDTGRSAIDSLLSSLRMPIPDWQQFGGGFEVLVAASAPIFWGFFVLSGLSLMILRVRDPERPRPFRVPGYPFTPLVFCTTAGFMLWSSYSYAGKLVTLLFPAIFAGCFLAIIQKAKP